MKDSNCALGPQSGASFQITGYALLQRSPLVSGQSFRDVSVQQLQGWKETAFLTFSVRAGVWVLVGFFERKIIFS